LLWPLCAKHGITVVAYASLGRGELLADDRVLAVAQSEGLPAPTVLLRWALQHGFCVIPKTSKVERVADFAPEQLLRQPLTAESLAALDAMATPDDDHKFCWDPSQVV
jgi:methylglyoxal/glyoxal reductase